MLEATTRVLKLLSLLQSRRVWTGTELSRELDVTERSVRRDVERLRSLGYPVHGAAGVSGGYRLGAGKELPPLLLEDDEAVAVAIGLRMAATGAVTGVEEASVRALEKLEQVLPKALRRRVGALHAVSVRLGEGGSGVDAAVLATVANACRDGQLLRFGYRGRGQEPSARQVEPYRLVHTSFRWYLLAYDLDREDWRTFRVDRVEGSPSPGRRFAPRPLPSDDVAAYVAQSVALAPYRHHARVTIHASAAKVSRRLSPLGGRIEAVDDERCVVHAGANDLESLAFHLGYLGFELEVHEPPELAACFRRIGERLARAARRRTRLGAVRESSR